MTGLSALRLKPVITLIFLLESWSVHEGTAGRTTSTSLGAEGSTGLPPEPLRTRPTPAPLAQGRRTLPPGWGLRPGARANPAVREAEGVQLLRG